jgi:hypothetical protein
MLSTSSIGVGAGHRYSISKPTCSCIGGVMAATGAGIKSVGKSDPISGVGRAKSVDIALMGSA